MNRDMINELVLPISMKNQSRVLYIITKAVISVT